MVLLVGIFGNISDNDLNQTVAAAPQLCSSGATLLWSRGRDLNDRDRGVRQAFADVGFAEPDYIARDLDSRPALGAMRYQGEPQPLVPARQLFTFLR